MAATAAKAPGSMSRNAFMLGVLTLGGTAIGVFYVGVILRYLYPKNAGDTPPLKVTLSDAGVTVPSTNSQYAFQNGVAGPIVYPTTTDGSVVVGVFVAKKD